MDEAAQEFERRIERALTVLTDDEQIMLSEGYSRALNADQLSPKSKALLAKAEDLLGLTPAEKAVGKRLE